MAEAVSKYFFYESLDLYIINTIYDYILFRQLKFSEPDLV